jgi:ABC-type Fe3+/spermidine/putrescine transport system ATPase subunit
MVSHDPTDGLSLSNHVIFIKDGKIIREGSPQEVYFDPRSAYVAKLLGKANIIKNAPFLPYTAPIYAVYPHHIQLTMQPTAYLATVRSVHFNGAYQEVELIFEGKNLLVHDAQFVSLQKGDLVYFEVNQYFALEN